MTEHRSPSQRARVSLGYALIALGDLRARLNYTRPIDHDTIADATAVAVAGIEAAKRELDAIDRRFIDLEVDLSVAGLRASGTR